MSYLNDKMLGLYARYQARCLRNEEGATVVEYAVLIALIIGVLLGVIQALTGAISGAFDAVTTAITG